MNIVIYEYFYRCVWFWILVSYVFPNISDRCPCSFMYLLLCFYSFLIKAIKIYEMQIIISLPKFPTTVWVSEGEGSVVEECCAGVSWAASRPDLSLSWLDLSWAEPRRAGLIRAGACLERAVEISWAGQAELSSAGLSWAGLGCAGTKLKKRWNLL